MSKEQFCYRILKNYSLIVDFDGKPIRKNVPKPKDGETFKQWKERLFGDSVSNIILYAPFEPAPQTKISTLQQQSKAEKFEKVFRALLRERDREQEENENAIKEEHQRELWKKRAEKKEAIKQAVIETKRQLISFPTQTLESLLDEHEEKLEPPVRLFFNRFLESKEENINTETLLNDLIKKYNGVVREYRKLANLPVNKREVYG